MNPFHWLVLTLLDIYFWIIIATVIISWLIAFNIINGYNDFVRTIRVALARLTEPVLGPVRRLLPDLGGIDVSPIIVLIGLQFVRYLYVYYVVYRGAA
jgi:YggT family protein